ncbi:MAG: hypothetical protein WA485_10525 [Candidatus Sulfotelmatobacter sp.]
MKQPRHCSKVISDNSTVSIVEMSNVELQRVFRVFIDNKEVGDITLDSWRSPFISFCGDGVFVWGGERAFRLRTDAIVEQFAVDEEISAIYPLPDNIILLCELSVRVLRNDFREVDRYSSNEVLLSGWWEGNVLHVPVWESKEINFTVEGRLKQM